MNNKAKILPLFICICIFISCFNDKHYFFTRKIEENLFLEIFNSPGGVYGNDYYYCYLTDSTSFRKYLGNHDENANIYLEMNSSQDKVIEYYYEERKLVDSTIYELNKLKNGKFEKIKGLAPNQSESNQ